MSHRLNVETRETQPIKVAYITYTPDGNETNQHEAIRKKFNVLSQKITELEYDTSKLRVIGIPVTSEEGLVRYECCIEVPEYRDAEEIKFKEIPGGMYCVLVMDKKPELIGPSIGRFFSEYIPEMGLRIDANRPVLEMYTENSMEFFVPVFKR